MPECLNRLTPSTSHETLTLLHTLEALGDIGFYVIKHKTPEEASRMEAEAIEIFRNVDELTSTATIRRDGNVIGTEEFYMGDFYLVHYYARMAVRLMQDGEAEKGERYLKAALDKAEEVHETSERREGRRFNSHSTMGIVCGILIEGGFLDEAAEIVRRTEERLAMPDTHLRIAEARAAAGEMEKAKAALRKALDVFLQSPPLRSCVKITLTHTR